MAARPDLTANADAPLSAEELEADRAASPQSTDPLDKPDPDDIPERDVVGAALTSLPPG